MDTFLEISSLDLKHSQLIHIEWKLDIEYTFYWICTRYENLKSLLNLYELIVDATARLSESIEVRR